MMIIDMDIEISAVDNSGKAADAGSVLTVDKDKTGNFSKVDIFEAGETEIRFGEEIPDPLFLRAGKDQVCAGIEFSRSEHRSEAVKIGIYMGSNNFH
jgi:hypothetical protein